MPIQNYEANLVKWYHSISGWAQFAVAFAFGVLVGKWLL